MDILVTGATGFVGRHLVPFLAELGHNVHAIRRPHSAYRFPTPEVNASIREYEYSGTIESMLSIVEQTQPEVVVHLATHYVPKHASDDLENLVDGNIRFGLHVLESMVTNACRRIISTGTNWQRRPGDGGYNPVNLYTATKEAFEKILEFYTARHQMEADVAYLFETYSSDDHRGKLLSVLMSAAESGETLNLSPGQQRINLTHIEDVCRALSILVERSVRKPESSTIKRFSLHSDDTLSVRGLVRKVEEAVNRPVQIKWGELPYRPGTVFIPWTDGLRPDNWKPNIALIDGLKEMWASRNR